MTRTHIFRGLGLAALLGAAACATPPKPNELDALEKLKQHPNLEAARRRAPDLCADSDRLLAKAEEEWGSNDLEEARRDSLLGSIKLKTALALVEQDQARARADRVAGDIAKSEDEYARLAKDLNAANEQIALLQRLKEGAAEQQRMQRELSQQQQAGAARDKLAAAELALKNADTVEAASYAKGEYQTAQDTLARAQAQLKASDFGAAASTSDLAKDYAERAFKTAKPQYDAASATKDQQAKNEALARDAAAVPGVTVRIDRRGDTQRLVLPLRNLFLRRGTSLGAGADGVIDGVAGLLKKYPSYPVLVIGYTDNRGRHDDLLARSQARATAVFSALVQRGVEAKRMVVSGMGGDEPVSDNRTTAGRAQNNRVEVVFLYQ